MSDPYAPDHTADDQAPPPLTETEAARLEALGAKDSLTATEMARADALQAKLDAHVAVAGQAAAEGPLDDPERAAAHAHEAIGHMVVLIEGIVASVPMLHHLGGRVAAMRAAFDKAHSAETP
jgi:hypothetical protein